MNCRTVNVFVCFFFTESLESLNSYFHSFRSRIQFLMCFIEFLISLIAAEYKVQRAGQQNHWEARAEDEYCILCNAILCSVILFRLALCPLQHCIPMCDLISLVFSLGEESQGNLCGCYWYLALVLPARHTTIKTINLVFRLVTYPMHLHGNDDDVFFQLPGSHKCLQLETQVMTALVHSLPAIKHIPECIK